MSLKGKNESRDRQSSYLIHKARQELFQPFEIILVFDLHVFRLLHDLKPKGTKMLGVLQLLAGASMKRSF